MTKQKIHDKVSLTITKIRRIILCSVLILFSLTNSALSQNSYKYDPYILILSPNQVTFDSSFKNEIDTLNIYYDNLKQKETEAERSGINQSQEYTNEEQKINQCLIKYFQSINFEKSFSFNLTQIMTVNLQESHHNLLILPKDTAFTFNDAIVSEFGDTLSNGFIISIPEITLNNSEIGKYSKVRFKIYDIEKRKFILDKIFRGDSHNSSYLNFCNEGSINCTFNNAINSFFEDFSIILFNRTSFLDSNNQNNTVLIDSIFHKYYNQGLDSSFIEERLKDLPSKFEKEKIFLSLINSDKDKFIWLYSSNKEIPDLNNLNFSTLKNPRADILDTSYFYNRIIYGLKYKNKWLIDISHSINDYAPSIESMKQKYFKILIARNYFTKDNPDFWENFFFSKTEEIKIDSTNNSDSTRLKFEQKKLKKYIGEYQQVTNFLMEQAYKEKKEFDSLTTVNILDPIYKIFVEHNKIDVISVDKFLGDFTIINSEDKKIIINPTIVKDKKGITWLRYFVYFQETKEFYEWTYFSPKDVQDNFAIAGFEISKALNSITSWEPGDDYLDDPSFFSNYILLKQGGDYKYLKRIKLD